MMKKVLWIATVMLLSACAEKKPLTPAEQWHGYCVSVGNAARSIALDRQNGIDQKQATEHASKVEDEMTRQFIFKILENVYALPVEQLKGDPDAIREKLKQQFMQQCLATPHDKMPKYKSF
ncbi:MAG TPA: hypothetical protein PLR79_04430 [Acinetobacter sp.]|jgi:hypothetical protein|nr:hypothetical protein [Acinetobacter sp.]HQW53801.1 hypothetical protein [Acinetobacter sp.]HQZ59427.1 hypothetical protein [Acinetobacter sp.]HRA91414.1 hypothetical protein [Acinetobacter sp.]